jgi:hypothetical protein
MPNAYNILDFNETIEVPHSRAHEGLLFSASHIFPAFADTTSIDLLIVTGVKGPHSAFEVSAGGQGNFYLYTGPTYSALGTPATVSNNNQFSSNLPLADIYYSPTITAVGTNLYQTFVPGGTSSGGADKAIGGAGDSLARGGAEWILATNTVYLVRFTNTSGASINGSLNVGFYHYPN